MNPSNDRIYLAGQALNGLIQSAMYGGELQTVFLNGEMKRLETLDGIRNRLAEYRKQSLDISNS